MKRFNLLRVSACLALLIATLATPTAHAQITWGTAQNITDSSDVITVGTLQYAYDYANSNMVVNGVPFAGANSGNAGGNVATTLTSFNQTAFTSTFAPFALLPIEYQDILVGATYVSSASTFTVTFSNLVSGRLYLVQFWVSDPRTTGGTRTDTLGSTGGNTTVLNFNIAGGTAGYPGQFAVGLFTASGTTQTLTVAGTTGSVPSMNAVQVRDVTGLNLWGGYQSSTWDYTSLNWGTGQSFATLNEIPIVNFADTNALGSAVTANVVYIQPAGVSNGVVGFLNNFVNYTLQSDAATPGISGATAINVLGSGSVTFTGPNTYTGATTIGSGTLVLSANGSITSPVILNGGTLDATATASFYLGASQPTTLAGGTLLVNDLTLDGAALSYTLSAIHPSITASTLTYGAGSSLTVVPPRFNSYPVQFPLITYTSIGGGAFDLNLNGLPYGYTGYLSNNVANKSIDLVLTSGLIIGSSDLNWDPAGSLGASDGSGNWSSTSTNWWNGTQTVPWTNDSGIAIFGNNTAIASTATITNTLSAGGIVFANVDKGAVTVGNSGGSALNLGGNSPSIQLACSNALNVISAPVVATNGLSVLAVNANQTSIGLRFTATTNNIVGLLAVGTPGNAAYTTPTGIYVDFNGANLNNLVVNTTNITVYSNATVRISGANSGYTLSPFPQQITLSGDGFLNANSGAWVVTGNGGGTIAANVILAGDSTIDFNVGAAGKTFNLNGVISGTGRLQMVSGNSTANREICVLTNASTYVGDTIIAGGTTLQLVGGDNRLPTGTALELGRSDSVHPLWNDYGKLTLGNAALAVNQSLASLNSDPNIANCVVAGGNSTTLSVLTVNNGANNNIFAGTLGGSAAPANMLALVVNGVGGMSLQGANLCAGGYTINAGTLAIGNGSSDYPLSGPIANNAAVTFNTASSLTYDGVISGAGSVTELGYGALTLSGTNTYTGPTLVQSGKLTLTTASTGAGPVTVTSSGEFDVALAPAANSLTNASLSLGGYTYDNETVGFDFRGDSPGATAPLTVGSLTNNGSTYINILNLGSLTVGSFPLIKYSGYVSNVNSSFNLNPIGSGVTATVQNNAANHSIDLVITALNAVKWTGATDTNWDYTTINWLNSGTLTGTSYADGNLVTLDDSGNNTAIYFNISPQPSSLVVSNAAKAYSFNGYNGLAGSVVLFKQGAGTLTVANNNNNTGGTVIQKGTLQVGDGSVDGTITAPITDNGSLVFNVIASDTSGGITGTGTVSKAGLGTLTLSSGSAYTGGTTVQAGRVYVTDSSALGTGTNATSVQAGSELWLDAAPLTIAQPLTIGGIGVDGTAGAFNVTAAASGSTWTGSIKTTANPTIFSAAASAMTLSGGLNGGTNVLTFAPVSDGNFMVSSNVTASQVLLNGLPGAINVGGLNLAGANPTLTNVQVLLPVAAGSSPPTTAGLWAYNNLALGTNCAVVMSNGQHIGDTGTRLGLGNNVSIPAGVSLTAYCPGTGVEGDGGYRCTFSVLDGTTNIWSGPIVVNGADPSLGTAGVFTFYAGLNGVGGSMTINGNVTATNGVVNGLLRGYSGSGIINGTLNFGTNTMNIADASPWKINSTGNTWSLLNMGNTSAIAEGTNNALCVTAPVNGLGLVDLNGFNQQVGGLYTTASSGTVQNSSTNTASTLAVSSMVGTNWVYSGTIANVGGAMPLNLDVAGSDPLTLTAAGNNYAGSTTIGTGAMLALTGSGSLSATTPIDVQAGGTFDVSGITNGGFILGAGQTLEGNGTVNGSLSASGTVAPGESVGTLTVTASVTLGGTAWMDVNNATSTNDLLNVGGTLTYGGTLVVTNISGTPYTANQVLKLFNAPPGQYTGSFANLVFPGVATYNTNNLVVNGTVQILTLASTVATNPTNISAVVSGGQLTLSWPTDHTGWSLEAQTNALNAGLNGGGTWYPVSGSTTTNSVTITINPLNPTVFYRLTYP